MCQKLGSNWGLRWVSLREPKTWRALQMWSWRRNFIVPVSALETVTVGLMMQWPPGRSTWFREGSLIELHLPSWLGGSSTYRCLFAKTLAEDASSVQSSEHRGWLGDTVLLILGNSDTATLSVSPIFWGIRDGSQIFFHILKPKNKPITHALVPWTMAVGWLLDLWCRFLWGCHEVFLHGYSSTGDLYLEVPSKGCLSQIERWASGCHARFIPWNFKHQVLRNLLLMRSPEAFFAVSRRAGPQRHHGLVAWRP